MPAHRRRTTFNGLVRHYFLRRAAEPRRSPGECSWPRRSATSRAMRSPSASGRGSRPSPLRSAHAFRSPRCRPARRCCRRWSPRCTGPTPQRRLDAGADSSRDRSRRPPGWSTSIGTSRNRRPNGTSSSTPRRPRRPASPVPTSRGGADGGKRRPLPACFTTTHAREDVPIVLRLPRALRGSLDAHPRRFASGEPRSRSVS